MDRRPIPLTAALTLTSTLAWPAATLPGDTGAAKPPTPAEIQIADARGRVENGRADARAYNALAAGLTRRARESGDGSYYDRALEALDRAARIDPDDPESLRLAAWIRMGRHEFALARRIAARYERAHPDDPWNLGVLGDAAMELGRYEEAAEAYQRMADLQPGPAAYSRVAYFRETSGDLPGALGLMRMALGATGGRDAEDRAWLLVQIGHLQDVIDVERGGGLAAAEATYRRALETFPDYHYALAALADVALRSGRAEEAASLSRRAISTAPHAERYLLLADALRTLGREDEARAAEGRFESLALANSGKPDNENHDLVLFYLERRPDPARAQVIARREAGIRRDVVTLDRLAWALYRDGRAGRAARLMREIVATGTRDPVITRHAKQILQAR
jgi:tetratricopeptide (TPR) repeat protein